MFSLITSEPKARRLLAAQLQSTLGTGAAYIALLVLAYQRFHSPLVVSAILLCEFLPSLLFGPVFGAAVDRWSRRRILVASELVRAIAFLGLAQARSFEAIVALAALAGAGQAAFQPAVMASLPSLVDQERLPTLTGVVGSLQEFGFMVGPVLAAGAIAWVHASGVLLANAMTFIASAAMLSTLRLKGTVPEKDGARRPSLLSSVRDGARALRRNRSAWGVVLSSVSFVCFLGTVNVNELVFVRSSLGGSAAAYAIAVATAGFGFTAGSLVAGRSESPTAARRLYLGGIGACAAGMAGCALAGTVWIALIGFLIMGLGNGAALVSENVILQQLIPEGIKGRVFGLKSAMIAGAFLTSYVAGGLLVNAVGPRATFGVLAVGSALVVATGRVALAPSQFQRASSVPAPAVS